MIVGYRHPEVALIEIMIGGLIDGEREKEREKERETEGQRKGKNELGNERTWPSGSALSRKPSRRSGPINCPPSSATRLHFIISTHFSIWLTRSISPAAMERSDPPLLQHSQIFNHFTDFNTLLSTNISLARLSTFFSFLRYSSSFYQYSLPFQYVPIFTYSQNST